MTNPNRPINSRDPYPAVGGNTIEEMLSAGADVDALIEVGELDGEWRSPEEIEAERQANLVYNADLLERSKHYTRVEIIF